MKVREEEKRSGKLVGAAETSKEVVERCRLQQNNLSIQDLPKRRKRPQFNKESSWQERQAAFAKKKQKQSRLSRASDHKVGESQDEQEQHLGERERGIRVGAWKRQSGLHSEGRQVPRR